ncbi:MAG: 30S ribosomal protein S18 [Candidatus Spechtbacteria bacterium SB0662_bin_43]|uniref:Small ribosomal subunit protein bS18 n=1 Tax=Candidatus Spechtbacteria bacterium SB0662_bin_43 TaxID=2604897 RepID=A0A845DAI4_9BACT|nr:30S ribosomal protein S18 [Candidatus Spechtbacteria bacterium SB0662_bin_43]
MKKQCYICTQTDKTIEWKDRDLLKRFLSADYKILSPRITGSCAKCQRRIAKAIKRARTMGIVPYSPFIIK